MSRTPKARAGARGYNSPLREAQTARTRELILDALTTLLSERAADEISTKDIASLAGVADRTVSRHFPDRSSLRDGLAQRATVVDEPEFDTLETLDALADILPQVYARFDEHEALTRAAVLLNADPRRLASATKQRSLRWRTITDRTFPELDDSQRLGLMALTHMLGSSQTWLRLREQFGVEADQSGVVAAWALQALLNETRRGNEPPSG